MAGHVVNTSALHRELCRWRFLRSRCTASSRPRRGSLLLLSPQGRRDEGGDLFSYHPPPSRHRSLDALCSCFYHLTWSELLLQRHGLRHCGAFTWSSPIPALRWLDFASECFLTSAEKAGLRGRWKWEGMNVTFSCAAKTWMDNFFIAVESKEREVPS